MILAFISIILIIIIHEFGHFLAGKLLKVPVYEFSIGMGPLIWSKKGKSETTYSIRCLPIGGFCSFDDGDSTGIQDVALNKEPVWKRIIIFLGGSFFNIISAFIVSIILAGVMGTPVATTTISNIASEQADSFLQANDEIIEIDGINVEKDYPLLKDTLNKTDGTANITVKRNSETVSQEVKLIKSGDSYLLGVNMTVDYQKTGVIGAFSNGIKYALDTSSSILSSLGNLFTGKLKVTDMSGIVGVVSVVGTAVNQNVLNLANYFILLSLNLGIFNLLPIPVLDGSKIIFCIYEAIFKKRVPEKVETNLTFAFAILLIIFTIIITISDIIKIF